MLVISTMGVSIFLVILSILLLDSLITAMIAVLSLLFAGLAIRVTSAENYIENMQAESEEKKREEEVYDGFSRNAFDGF